MRVEICVQHRWLDSRFVYFAFSSISPTRYVLFIQVCTLCVVCVCVWVCFFLFGRAYIYINIYYVVYYRRVDIRFNEMLISALLLCIHFPQNTMLFTSVSLPVIRCQSSRSLAHSLLSFYLLPYRLSGFLYLFIPFESGVCVCV